MSEQTREKDENSSAIDPLVNRSSKEESRAEEDKPKNNKRIQQIFDVLNERVQKKKDNQTDGDKQTTQEEKTKLLKAVNSSGGPNEGLYGFAGGLFWSIIQAQNARRSKDDATNGTPKDAKADVKHVKSQVETILSQSDTDNNCEHVVSLNNLRGAVMSTLLSHGTTDEVFPHDEGASYAIRMVLEYFQVRENHGFNVEHDVAFLELIVANLPSQTLGNGGTLDKNGSMPQPEGSGNNHNDSSMSQPDNPAVNVEGLMKSLDPEAAANLSNNYNFRFVNTARSKGSSEVNEVRQLSTEDSTRALLIIIYQLCTAYNSSGGHILTLKKFWRVIRGCTDSRKMKNATEEEKQQKEEMTRKWGNAITIFISLLVGSDKALNPYKETKSIICSEVYFRNRYLNMNQMATDVHASTVAVMHWMSIIYLASRVLGGVKFPPSTTSDRSNNTSSLDAFVSQVRSAAENWKTEEDGVSRKKAENLNPDWYEKTKQEWIRYHLGYSFFGILLIMLKDPDLTRLKDPNTNNRLQHSFDHCHQWPEGMVELDDIKEAQGSKVKLLKVATRVARTMAEKIALLEKENARLVGRCSCNSQGNLLCDVRRASSADSSMVDSTNISNKKRKLNSKTAHM